MPATRSRTAFCDQVHRILDFGVDRATKRLVKGLVDSRAFQRLRRISQLGLAAHVFPGATHSRFAHSLGAGHLARLVVQQLAEQFAESDDPRKAEVAQHASLVLAAGLLHDIGHGPFSHSFERAFERITQKRIKHEVWTQAVMRGPLKKILRENSIDDDVLSSVFAQSGKLVPTYLKQIISSQLDVDRMDYLVRDAHFSGVSLGQIDLHYLIRSLAVIDHGEGHATLGVTRKGVKPYEAFALARHHMNRAVYFHPKVATLESLMEECLHRMAAGVREGRSADGIPDCLLSLMRADCRNVDVFVDENLSSYLDLTEDHVWTAISYIERRWDGRPQELAAQLLSRDLPEYYFVHPGKRRELGVVLERAGFGGDHFRLLSTESRVYGEGADDGVFVITEAETAEPVSRHSFALTAYANKPEAETLLVVLDSSRSDDICRAARDCIFQPKHGLAAPSLKGGVRKAKPSDPPPSARSA